MAGPWSPFDNDIPEGDHEKNKTAYYDTDCGDDIRFSAVRMQQTE